MSDAGSIRRYAAENAKVAPAARDEATKANEGLRLTCDEPHPHDTGYDRMGPLASEAITAAWRQKK